MFRHFYRIWDKFRYKYKDRSEIVAAAIYTYKGDRGKYKRYITWLFLRIIASSITSENN